MITGKAGTQERAGEFHNILAGMLDQDSDTSAQAFSDFDQFVYRIAPRGRNHLVRVK